MMMTMYPTVYFNTTGAIMKEKELQKLKKDALIMLLKEKMTASKPNDIVTYVKNNVVFDWNVENLILVILNASSQILSTEIISIGTINKSLVSIPYIFRQIFLCPKSYAFVLLHNHPSGNINPSDEDNQITRKLKESSNLMGIEMVDHIIITELDYYSYNSNAQM